MDVFRNIVSGVFCGLLDAEQIFVWERCDSHQRKPRNKRIHNLFRSMAKRLIVVRLLKQQGKLSPFDTSKLKILNGACIRSNLKFCVAVPGTDRFVHVDLTPEAEAQSRDEKVISFVHSCDPNHTNLSPNVTTAQFVILKRNGDKVVRHVMSTPVIKKPAAMSQKQIKKSLKIAAENKTETNSIISAEKPSICVFLSGKNHSHFNRIKSACNKRYEDKLSGTEFDISRFACNDGQTNILADRDGKTTDESEVLGGGGGDAVVGGVGGDKEQQKALKLDSVAGIILVHFRNLFPEFFKNWIWRNPHAESVLSMDLPVMEVFLSLPDYGGFLKLCFDSLNSNKFASHLKFSNSNNNNSNKGEEKKEDGEEEDISTFNRITITSDSYLFDMFHALTFSSFEPDESAYNTSSLAGTKAAHQFISDIDSYQLISNNLVSRWCSEQQLIQHLLPSNVDNNMSILSEEIKRLLLDIETDSDVLCVFLLVHTCMTCCPCCRMAFKRLLCLYLLNEFKSRNVYFHLCVTYRLDYNVGDQYQTERDFPAGRDETVEVILGHDYFESELSRCLSMFQTK